MKTVFALGPAGSMWLILVTAVLFVVCSCGSCKAGENAEAALKDQDSTSYQRLTGKIALSVENSVQRSDNPDPAIAGASDGKAALSAFKKAYAAVNPKKAPANLDEGVKKFDPDLFKKHVLNIVCADLAPEDSEKYHAYQSAYQEAIDTEAPRASGFGPVPENSERDGSIRIVDDYIKEGMNDPDSYKFVKAWEPYLTKDGWKVKYIFRGKNVFGGVTTKIVYVIIRNGEVVSVESR